jgi:hypothetical protein
MLDEDVYATIEDLAKSKGIGKTDVSEILRLTLLAPEIVEAILDGRQSAGLQLDDLLEGSRWSGPGRNACSSASRRLVLRIDRAGRFELHQSRSAEFDRRR